MGRIGRVRVDNDNILEIGVVGGLLLIDGCGRLEKDFNVGGGFSWLEWRLEKRKEASMGNA